LNLKSLPRLFYESAGGKPLLAQHYQEGKIMKSLASINTKDIETIKMALNDAISDINVELKNALSETKMKEVMEYKTRYTRVYDKLRTNPSIYALAEYELDIAAGGLNDAIEMLEENMADDDLDDQEKSDIMTYKNDCQRVIDILAG
jgi:polyribonucleotide nucleotidyltransferase